MGPMLAKPFARAKANRSNLWNAGNTGGRRCRLFSKMRVTREHEFISATEIGHFGVIAVMAEIQRNVGIAVALSGMPRGFAIAKGMSR